MCSPSVFPSAHARGYRVTEEPLGRKPLVLGPSQRGPYSVSILDEVDRPTRDGGDHLRPQRAWRGRHAEEVAQRAEHVVATSEEILVGDFVDRDGQAGQQTPESLDLVVRSSRRVRSRAVSAQIFGGCTHSPAW